LAFFLFSALDVAKQDVLVLPFWCETFWRRVRVKATVGVKIGLDDLASKWRRLNSGTKASRASGFV